MEDMKDNQNISDETKESVFVEQNAEQNAEQSSTDVEQSSNHVEQHSSDNNISTSTLEQQTNDTAQEQRRPYQRYDRDRYSDDNSRYRRDDDRNDRGTDYGGGRPGIRRFRKYDKIATRNLDINYKKPEILQEFLTDQGKILSRQITGSSAQNQRRLVREVKRARYLGFLPSA